MSSEKIKSEVYDLIYIWGKDDGYTLSSKQLSLVEEILDWAGENLPENLREKLEACK